MKRQIIEMSIADVYKQRDQFNFPEYQREPNIWREKDKQLLIDSILADIDIPKLYLFKEKNGKSFDVIDGQQRLWAIWEFIDGQFSYESRGRIRKFKELEQALQDKIINYKLQFTLITDAKEEYLKELFLRLQLGLLLNTGEKLHASSGEMRDFVFKDMKGSKFIKAVNIPLRRYAKETLCAQIAINSFSAKLIHEFSRTRYEDLKHFFEQYKAPAGEDKRIFTEQTRSIISTLKKLEVVFGERAEYLRNRSLVLSIYLFIEELINKSDDKTFEKNASQFVSFILEFTKRLREEARAGFRRRNEELYIFESFLSNAPGEKYQIENRQKKLHESFDYYQQNKGKIKGDK